MPFSLYRAGTPVAYLCAKLPFHLVQYLTSTQLLKIQPRSSHHHGTKTPRVPVASSPRRTWPHPRHRRDRATWTWRLSAGPGGVAPRRYSGAWSAGDWARGSSGGRRTAAGGSAGGAGNRRARPRWSGRWPPGSRRRRARSRPPHTWHGSWTRRSAPASCRQLSWPRLEPASVSSLMLASPRPRTGLLIPGENDAERCRCTFWTIVD